MNFYQNPHAYVVSLTGPDGNIIKLASREIRQLPDYYERYRTRGFIRLVKDQTPQEVAKSIARNITNPMPKKDRHVISQRINRTIVTKPIVAQKVVGRAINAQAAKIFNNDQSDRYPISNNIGVGILSYNRLGSLKRLIDSIRSFTDLNRTTVFVSDDGSDDPKIKEYLDELEADKNLVIIRNHERLGIAGNSNRLLRALSRFKYGIILNDDIQILSSGWETFYTQGLIDTGFHHFCHRQAGVYGAVLGEEVTINGRSLRLVKEKPHGALLAFTNQFLQTVGAFDRKYGIYGMEHIDWSSKAFEFELQPSGFYDIKGSENYVLLHSEASVVDEKSKALANAKEVFKKRRKEKLTFDVDSTIPSVSYVVPFRELERNESLATVVNNIRAQKYPNIEIIISEQDKISKIDKNKLEPCIFLLNGPTEEHQFNKSLAFNRGVQAAKYEKLILHDADMLAVNDYTKIVSSMLDNNMSCHMGATVLYATQDSTRAINANNSLDGVNFERVVGYYEGGSFGILKKHYWEIGGFCEDFWGYGNEDCEFYHRMSSQNGFLENRVFNLLHLWHTRASGWTAHHEKNKALEASLRKSPMSQRILELQRVNISRGYHENIAK